MLKAPLVVLGHSAERLFIVEDDEGRRSLPIFSKPELILDYRAHFDADLSTFLLSDSASILALLELLVIKDGTVLILLDPVFGQTAMAYSLQEAHETLRKQTDQNHPHIRNGKAAG